MNRGGNAPCVLNAANEIVVAAFLKDEISFTGMSDVIESNYGECELYHPGPRWKITLLPTKKEEGWQKKI